MQMIKLEELIKLATILKENDYSNKNIEVVIKVKTNELLNKINEEIYFKNKTENSSPLTHVDEIILNINGIKFKYIVDDIEKI